MDILNGELRHGLSGYISWPEHEEFIHDYSMQQIFLNQLYSHNGMYILGNSRTLQHRGNIFRALHKGV